MKMNFRRLLVVGSLTASLFTAFSTSALANTYVVRNTSDSQQGSFREAIKFANSHPGTSIRFNIPLNDGGYSEGVFLIVPSSPLPEIIADKTVIDGSTQTVFTGNTNQAGPEIEISGATIPYSQTLFGLTIKAARCLVRDLTINRFDAGQINISGKAARGNVVLGCYVGVDARGMRVVWRQQTATSVVIDGGAAHNLIGGNTFAARNILSSIHVRGAGTYQNRISGNFIGVNVNGTRILRDSSGVSILAGAQFNIIGGDKSGQGNLIGSSNDRVVIEGKDTENNRVQGNHIGTLWGGNKPIDVGTSSHWAIVIKRGASNNLIGGDSAGARNVVCAPNSNVITIDGNYKQNNPHPTEGNVIRGNHIGIGADGQSTLGGGVGIVIYHDARRNIIGGTKPGEGNLISGLTGSGVSIWGSQDGSDANIIQGNFIGTDASGTRIVGNGGSGISIQGASQNLVGGSTPGAGNVISGNRYAGITIYDKGADANIVQGNLIGVDESGTRALGNGTTGVWLGGVRENRIGGSRQNEGNVISGNGWSGVFLFYEGCEANRVEGNFIGTDRTSTLPLGNGGKLEPNGLVALNRQNVMKGGGAGVLCLGGANNNFIGGKTADKGNVIAHNIGDGIRVEQESFGNAIRGNAVFGNSGLAIDLREKWQDDSVPTKNDWTDADSEGGNALQNYPRLVINDIARQRQSVKLDVSGSLHSTPSASYDLDLFLSPALPAGKPAQGRHFIGSISIQSDEKGEARFAFNLTISANLFDANSALSATATHAPSGNSSEIGRPAVVRPVGKIVFQSRSMTFDGLFSINPDGSELQHFMNLELWSSAGSTAISSDASTLLFMRSANNDGSGAHHIWKMNLDGSGRVDLTPGTEYHSNPALSADGKIFAFMKNGNAGGLRVMKSDGTALVDESHKRVGFDYMSLTGEGGVLLGSRAGHIFRLNSDGSESKQLTVDSGSNYRPVVSADGKKIVWNKSQSAVSGIYIMDGDGSNQRQLTSFGYSPAFNGDGNQIVFAGDDGNHEGLFIVGADGKNLRHIPNTEGTAFPLWMADEVTAPTARRHSDK